MGGRTGERAKIRMKKGERFGSEEKREGGNWDTAGCGVCGHPTHTNSQHLMRTR